MTSGIMREDADACETISLATGLRQLRSVAQRIRAAIALIETATELVDAIEKHRRGTPAPVYPLAERLREQIRSLT